MRRSSMTMEPITTAMPRMCTLWMIGGKPGMLLKAHNAQACGIEPSRNWPVSVMNSGNRLLSFSPPPARR